MTDALRGPRAQGKSGQSDAPGFSAAELVAMPAGVSPSTRIKGSVSIVVGEKCSVRDWWRSDLPFESIPHLFVGLPEVALHLVGPFVGSERVIASGIPGGLFDPASVTGATFSAFSLLVTDSRFPNYRRVKIALSGITNVLVNRSCTSENSSHTPSSRHSARPTSGERTTERCHRSLSGICLNIG